MRQEGTGIRFLRVVYYVTLILFLPLLYWSSNLTEHRLIEIQKDLEQLKKRPHVSQPPSKQVQTLSVAHTRPHIRSELPNLLKRDPFREDVLPKLLGKGFTPQGDWQSAVIVKPHSLLPFVGYASISEWIGLCTGNVGRLQFGKYETLSPDLAIKVEKRPRKNGETEEYWVHLREGVFWQPLEQDHFPDNITLAPHFFKRHPVTAHDFKFYFDAVMNPHNRQPGALSARSVFGDIEEFEVIDPLTFVVRWKEEVIGGKKKIKYAADQYVGGLAPLPSFLYQYFTDGTKIIDEGDAPHPYRTSSVWAQNFERHWAKNIIPSCGAWIFDGMSDTQLCLRRNPNHYFPLDALMERKVYHFKNHVDSLWKGFKEGVLPTYVLQPGKLIEHEQFLASPTYEEQKAQGQAIRRLDYLTNAYMYVGWNQNKPLFQSRAVRQAMTLAIDRNRLINQNLNQMGQQLTGPFSFTSSGYDHTVNPWPFDPRRARALLEEEGWFDQNGDGVLEKELDGIWTPFRFQLTYFVKQPVVKSVCEYIAGALKEIGIVCELLGVDTADLSASFDEKSFDALCMGWSLGTPPEDPRQLWHSSFADMEGSSNAFGFKNKEADQLIEGLTFEKDHDRRNELYHKFHRLIHQEQPYTFLYIPKVSLLYRETVQNVWIPKERQDLIPGANIPKPLSSIFWIDTKGV